WARERHSLAGRRFPKRRPSCFGGSRILGPVPRNGMGKQPQGLRAAAGSESGGMVQPTRRFQWRAVGAALVVAWAGSALAQTVTATVRGTVTDPTGGAIPAAKATLINLDTG